MTNQPSPLALSKVVVGMMRLNEWGLSADGLVGFIEKCLDLGATSFDHADIYGGYTCEEKFGEALKRAPRLRQHIQLISKCGIQLVYPNRPNHKIKQYDTSTAYIIQSVEKSLQNLDTDYLDLLLIHRPDPLMNTAEVAEAFSKLQASGKVLAFGVSNFTPSQVSLLGQALSMPLKANQIECSLLQTSPLFDGTLDSCQQGNMIPMAWGPFAGGAVFTGGGEREHRVREMLNDISAAHQASPDQIALAWLSRHPSGIIPVLGTGKLERITTACQATSIELSREEWYSLLRASHGRDVP